MTSSSTSTWRSNLTAAPEQPQRGKRRFRAVRLARASERPHGESKVDVLVVTRSERDDKALIPSLWRLLGDLDSPRIIVDPRQRSRAWVEDRRAIDSFFLRDVDRDTIVLYGGS